MTILKNFIGNIDITGARINFAINIELTAFQSRQYSEGLNSRARLHPIGHSSVTHRALL